MMYNPTMHKLSNGVTVLLDPMDLQTTNVKVRFYTGARDEQPHEYGITHFAEHMYCKGTKKFATQKIMDEYIDVNAGTKNAGTGMADIRFYGRILGENLNILIEFLGEQIQNSLFAEDQIEIERKVISDELRRYLDSPGDQFATFISQSLFAGHTFHAPRVIGTLENIQSFTREQMLEYMRLRLSAKNCIIAISGKIEDENKVLECLENTFAWLPTFDVSENTDLVYIPAIAHNSKTDKKNVKIKIYFPDIHEINYENRFKRMCVGKFERFMKEKMYEVIRRDNGLVYGFGLTDIGNEKFGLNGFSTETSVENLEKCVALIASEAYKVYSQNSITDQDLERFELKDRLDDADWLESAGRRCDKLLNFYHNHGRVYDFFDTVQLSNSVTAKDVVEHSRGYFDGDMSIMTQGADFDLDLKKIWEDNFK
ncbi:MAG: insulinase family protein [Rickettsiales bacterium]|nr:insulinase family protein [Rickettsiales bacterium]